MRQFISTSRRFGSLAALVLFALLLMQSTVVAQQTGTVTGTVLDSTGAVVPGAKVTLLNQATKDARQTTSNEEGFFNFAGVMPAVYDVRVEMKGFKTWAVNGYKVSPGDRRHITGIDLAVGGGNESVTVEAITTQVAVVDSGERSATLTGKDIKTMALVGRDVTELTKVLPGFSNFTGNGGLANQSGYDPTVSGIGSSVGNGYSANGTPNRGGTDLVSDGAHVIDPGCNCNATQTINPDMVEEVKVQTSNFGADSAKGPVVINAVSKGGSSQYHGEAYLHFRDQAMNSSDWINGYYHTTKPDDRYWYPGGNFGGPVKFPGAKGLDKKMFFWTGYEYYNQKFPDREPVLRAVVPTMGMRQGNFTAAGEGNAAFCGVGGWLPQCDYGSFPAAWAGIVPQASMDAGGLAIMKMIPEPNADPTANNGFNYIMPAVASRNGYMWHSRVDYNFTENTKLNISYNLQKELNAIPVMLWWQPPQSVLYPGDASQRGDSHTLSANLLHVFSPTLTNEFIGTFAYLSTPGVYNNKAAVSRQALGYPYKGVFKNGVDIMPSLSNGWWIPGYPMMYQADMSDYESVKFLPTLADNITKVFGKHSVKAGLYWEITGNKQGSVDNQNALVEFGTWGASGNPVANILLGAPTHYREVSKNAVTDMKFNSLSFYVQDSWKVTPRLTLDLGMRFEHSPAWTDATGDTGLATWTQERYLADKTAGVTVLPGVCWTNKAGCEGTPLSGRDVKAMMYSPRVGLSWDVFGKGNTLVRGGWGAYRWRDQYNDYAGALSTALGTRTFDAYTTTLSAIDKVVTSGDLAVSSIYAVDPKDDAQPVTYTYNLTVSQKAPWNSLLEVAYVGNNSEDMMNYLLNQNIIPVGSYFKAAPNTGILYGSPKEADDHKADFRPFPEYTELNIYRHGAYANYNALQVSWNRPQGPVTFGFNYTFSKALGIQGKADPVNLRPNYGVLNSDRTHVFNAAYSYDSGNRFKGNRILAGFLNYWTISGITSIQSGANIQASYDKGFRITGTEWTDTATGKKYQVNNTNILGTPDYVLIPLLTCDPRGSNDVYVNYCFAVPAVGGTENGPINMPYMRGPSFINNDLSIRKNIKFKERQNVQIGFSAFNVFNHPLQSFDNNDDNNIRLHYDWVTKQQEALPSGVTYGVPYLKHGRRVLEMTLRYSF